MDVWESLELDEDEAEHRKNVTGQSAQHIALANSAATLSLDGLSVVRERMLTSEPKFLVSLLLAKCAQNVRFACTGLTLGYYSGAYAVLRSAFEGMTYAALFESDPAEIAKWLKNELSSKLQKELTSAREEQKTRAKKALLDWEEPPMLSRKAWTGF